MALAKVHSTCKTFGLLKVSANWSTLIFIFVIFIAQCWDPSANCEPHPLLIFKSCQDIVDERQQQNSLQQLFFHCRYLSLLSLWLSLSCYSSLYSSLLHSLPLSLSLSYLFIYLYSFHCLYFFISLSLHSLSPLSLYQRFSISFSLSDLMFMALLYHFIFVIVVEASQQ